MNCCLTLKPPVPKHPRPHTHKLWDSKCKNLTGQSQLCLVLTNGGQFNNMGRASLKRNHRGGDDSMQEIFLCTHPSNGHLSQNFVQLSPTRWIHKGLLRIFSLAVHISFFSFYVNHGRYVTLEFVRSCFSVVTNFYSQTSNWEVPKYYKCTSSRRRKGWNRCNFSVCTFKSF